MFFYISIFISILFSLEALAMMPMDVDGPDQRWFMHTEYKILDDRYTDKVDPQVLKQNFSTMLPQGFTIDSVQTRRTLSAKKEDIPQNQRSLEKVVIGENGKKENGMTSSPSHSFPNHTHGYLKMVFTDESGQDYTGSGTGTLIGPCHVLTAGHCIYDKPHKNARKRIWAKSVGFYAGKHGDEQPIEPVNGIILLSVNAWVASNNGDYDFGMIVLEKDIGYETGWLGMLTTPIGFLNNFKPLVNVTGYPVTRPDTRPPLINRPPLRYTMAHALQSASEHRLQYILDTEEGQSGAGLCTKLPGSDDNYLIGTHVRYNGNNANEATRINNEKFNCLCCWMSLFLPEREKYTATVQGLKNKQTNFENFLIHANRTVNCPASQYSMGQCYENENCPEVYEQDPRRFPLHKEKALEWYIRAAAGHNIDAKRKIQNLLPNVLQEAKIKPSIKFSTIGDYFFYSYIAAPPIDKNIIPLQYHLAGQWYTRACNEGDQEEKTKAHGKLGNLRSTIGNLYFNGYGCDYFLGLLPITSDRWKWHYTQALNWYNEAGLGITSTAYNNRLKIYATGHTISNPTQEITRYDFQRNL